MNILPKKRWHVRTKDNIARVRKDEALAAEEEKKKQMRIEIAEREARTEALRNKARQQYGSYIPIETPKTEVEPMTNRHVNLFHELEENKIVSNQGNKDYEEEKKQEKEKYEKQIGYLMYLGQDTNEITGQVSWYNKPREKDLDNRTEISKKQKVFEDPLEDIRKYLGCEGVKKLKESVKMEKIDIKDLVKRQKQFDSEKHKKKASEKHKKSKKHKKEKKHKKKKKKHKKKESSESEESEVEEVKKVDVERLRAERIRREMQERKRASELFAKLNGIEVKTEIQAEPETSQKYNSQFNPHLAKQNYVNR